MTDQGDQPDARGRCARATAAFSTQQNWHEALSDVLATVAPPETEPPDLVILFASARFTPDFAHLLTATRHHTGTSMMIGCSVSGFLATGIEIEQQPGLAMMAVWLPGAMLYPVRLDQDAMTQVSGGSPPSEAAVNGWLMLADPVRIDTLGLTQQLKQRWPGIPIVGGMSSGPEPGTSGPVFLNDMVYPDGAVAMGIGGPYTITAHVSQGCFPVGEPWTVTEVQRNALIGISNRPAVEVLQETLEHLTPRQRDLAPGNVMVGLAVDEYLDHYEHGDFFVRGILGVDHKRGAVVIGGLPRVGQTMQFHLRDAEAASHDLRCTVASAVTDHVPVAAMLCTCQGRGSRLFGKPHHDSQLVRDMLPGVPLVGGFGPGEIGPLGRTTVLHGFTATLAVIRSLVSAPGC